MKITWAIESRGAGEAQAQTVDEAAQALADAIRSAYRADGPEVTAHVLTTVLAPLRSRLVTDGRYAVERGEAWSASFSGLVVSLTP